MGWSQPIDSDAVGLKCLGSLSQASATCGEAHRHFPHGSQCSGWTGPCGSYYDEASQQQPSGILETQGL